MMQPDHLSPGARLARSLLRLRGWRVIDVRPPARKGVVIVYPHTSNWDLPIGILARSVLQLPMGWVGKQSLFRQPFRSLMLALGGVPVDRSKSTGLVDQLRLAFDRRERFYLVITPEGTRSRTDHWKSGFYYLARYLDLPLGLAFIDYEHREVGIGAWLHLTGDVERDLDQIREAYRTRRGKRPELAGDIRFRERNAPQEARSK
jgi:1-acyl-sn-glycerol-3-phosphate acyltransferase